MPMGRGAKPAKAKVQAKSPVARKSLKNEGPRVRQLQKRLEDALKREAEALEQQTATAEILRVIGTSPMDAQPVFDAIARSGVRVCGAHSCALFVVDGDMLRVAATHGVPAERVERFRKQFPMPLSAENHVTQVLHERRVFHLADIEHNPATTPEHIENARLGGYHTRLMVPMLRGDRALGLIAVTHQAPTPFPDQQVALLKTFADQAVIAIENVRLFKELEARNRDLTEALEQRTATAEILRVISSSPMDVQPVFEAIVASAARLCDAVDGTILRVDGDKLVLVAHEGPISSQPVGPFGALTPGRPSARAVLEARTIHVVDLQAEVDEYPEGSALARSHDFRTVLNVPLIREAAAIGVIIIRRTEARPFTERQTELLKTFADQAIIAIENVRLFKELQGKNQALTEAHAQVTEALEQQTATAEILRVISRSPTDVQPVFDAIADAALRLCGAASSIVTTFDGELVHLSAQAHVSPEGTDAFHSVYPRRPSLSSASGRAILTRAIVQIPDVTARTEYDHRHLARVIDIRSILAVPMLRDGLPIGSINVHKAQPGAFSDKQIVLLQTFADQAVIAIENVRLFTELQTSNRDLTTALDQQTATSDILRVISQSQTDVQPVFAAIVDSAVRLLRGNASTLSRIEDDQIALAAMTSTSDPGDASQRARFPMSIHSEEDHAQAVRNRVPLHSTDAHRDPRLPETQHASARLRGYRSLVVVPLVRHDEAVGALGVARREPGGFTDDEIALLKTFADQAVIAIENVRLFKELEARNRDLTEALEQQTATAEILRVISQSQTDVQPVFDAIVASAVRLLGGYSGLLTRIAGDHIELAALTSTDAAGDAAQRALFPQSLHSERPHAQAIRDRAPFNIADAHTDPRVPEAAHAAARVRGYRSWVVVPLLRHDETVGTISVTRREPGGFTDDEIALLKTFTDQAVIAIENVRLFTELQQKNEALTQAHAQVTEALEQQTATAEILRVISRSQTDVQPVFDTIVRSAVRLCDGLSSSLHQFDGELLHHVAQHNFSSEALEAVHRICPARPTRALLAGRVILERAVVHIPDIELDPEWQHQALSRAIGWRSGLYVPMLREGAPIGVIAVARAEPGPFSDNEIELLKTFADQAVIAVENVRLFKELQARTGELTQSVEKLTALGEVSRAVSSTLDVETVLNTIVSRASQLAGAAGCSIYEYDEAAEQFELRATHNDDTEFVAALRAVPLRKGEGLMGRAAEMREPIQIPDITQPGAYQSSVRDTLIRFGYRALLAVPLLREDQIIGSLSFNRKEAGEFPPEVIEVLRTFATQSALAIQNARLFREIADKSAQLEAASRHKSEFLANMSHELRTPLNAIIGFSEVLTERMFGELNDKQEEYLKDIHASGQHLLSLINDILDLSKIEAGRMELELSDFHLPSAIENALILVRERASRRGIRLGSTIDERLGMIGGDERKVKQVLLNLLSNALKFTPEGGRIDVDARLDGGMVEISVADTGIGIAPADQDAAFEEFRQVGAADKKAEGTGLGLALSRKFIELHGGKIWVKSQVGQGSTFTFTLPVRREE
jgi:GAF domain-containing protein